MSDPRAVANMRQGSNPDRVNVAFLPPEIYLVIARYVQVRDLPNFCLASKTLVDAGRPELLHTIVLRPCLRSWTALKKIHHHEQLSRLVRRLIVDVTLWRVGTDVRDWHEWTRHCESQANHYTLVNIDPAQAALYKELAQSRHLWEAYLLRLEKEKALYEEIPTSVIRLPNLQKVHIVRGAFVVKERHVHRLNQDSRLLITAPLSEWRGDSISERYNINQLIPRGFGLSVSTNITRWRLDGLTEQNFKFLRNMKYTENRSVISLRMRNLPCPKARTRMSPLDYVHRCLSLWHDLESLELHFQKPVADAQGSALPDITHYFGPATPLQGFSVPDTREHPLTLQRLRKLSLAHFTSSPGALILLVSRHSSTLRDLRLHGLKLRRSTNPDSRPSSWKRVFRELGRSADLDKLRFSGLCRNLDHEDDDWDFDAHELGNHVAAWVLKGAERSGWEGVEQIRRSGRSSHDQISAASQTPGQNGQNGTVTEGGN